VLREDLYEAVKGVEFDSFHYVGLLAVWVG
jgi:hypothetical protein